MSRASGALLLAVLSLAGCGPKGGVSDAGAAADAGPAVTCRELFAPGAGGECEPVLPEADCAPGTMPVLGQRFCQPVGWTACTAGFEPEPTGWGCREVLPPAACTGATLEVLGQRACQPLGDCAAAFPPAGANYFVDRAGPLDATHFRSIGAALQAAPAGAVIAIESGQYAENVTATRPVKLVGRCPAQAKLVAPVNGMSGLTVAAKGVEVEGLGFSGHWYAIELMAGAEATVTRSLIEGSFDNGIVADKAGARLKLVGSVVRGTRPRQSAGGVGVLVVTGGFAELDGSALVDNSGVGLFVGEAGASAAVARTVVRDTRVDATGAFGYAVNVNHGASLTLTGSALLGSRRSGLNVQTAGTVATVSDTVVRGTRNDVRRYATGITVVGGPKLTLTRVLVTDTNGPGVVALDPGTELRVKDSDLAGNVVDTDNDFGNGLYVFNQAMAFVEGSALVNNHGSAMQVVGEGTVVSVFRSLLRGTRGIGAAAASMGLGTGVLQGAEAQFTESAMVDNQHSGVFLLEKGSARLIRCAVLGTRFEPFQQGLGHGVFLQVDSKVDLTQTVLRGNAGIGVVFSESGGALRDSYVGQNAVGIHAQDGSLLSEVAVVPATVGPREVLVSAGTEFVGNATRVGTGTLQLPPPPAFNQPK